MAKNMRNSKIKYAGIFPEEFGSDGLAKKFLRLSKNQKRL